MTGEPDEPGTSTLPPDEAFTVLGNESRINILRSLGEADGALTFSELYERVDIPDSGQFSYHLDKLLGHFVQKSDDEYELQQAGLRVIEAVLSGAITEAAESEPTRVDASCPYCGGSIEVSYQAERLLQRCTECTGGFRGWSLPDGTLDRGYLPPAGVKDRSPEELVIARNTWSVIEQVAMANDICPRCAGHVDHSVRICENHENDGICDQCNRRKSVLTVSRCQNCPHENTGYIIRIMFGDPAFRSFFEQRDIDLFSLHPDAGDTFISYDEDIRSIDPFKARFTFTVADDTISLTVDDDLSVVGVSTSTSSPSG